MPTPTESNDGFPVPNYKWLIAYDVNDGECIAFPMSRCALSTMVAVVHRSIEADTARIQEQRDRFLALADEANPQMESAFADALDKIKQGAKRVNTTELLVRFDGKMHCVRDVIYCVDDAEMFHQLGITPTRSTPCDLTSLTPVLTSSQRSELTGNSANPSVPGITPE